jgi:hypothetical protein
VGGEGRLEFWGAGYGLLEQQKNGISKQWAYLLGLWGSLVVFNSVLSDVDRLDASRWPYIAAPRPLFLFPGKLNSAFGQALELAWKSCLVAGGGLEGFCDYPH